MANIFDISQLNPVKLYQQADIFGNGTVSPLALNSFDPNLNQHTIDNDFNYFNLQKWADKVKYWQPFQQGDTITLQWLGVANYTLPAIVNYNINLLDCNGNIVKYKPVDQGATVGTQKIRSVSMQLFDVPEGRYFVQLAKIGAGGDYFFYAISEGIEIKKYHADTAIIKYKNTSNAFGIFFETGIEFQLRIPCAKELLTGSKFNVYEDQPLNLTLLSGVPYREWQCTFGTNNKQFPEWMLDKLERILLCDTLRIDNVYYTRIDGSKLEPQRVDKSPLMSAVITVREKNNDQDLSINEYPQILVSQFIDSEWFYVGSIYITSTATTVVVQKYFNGMQNLCDYLNVDSLQNSYFALNNSNQLVYITNDATLYAQFSPGYTLQDVLTGHVIFDIDTKLGTKIITQMANTALVSKYAFFWGDGSANTIGSTTPIGATLNHVYPSNKKYKAFLFFDQVHDLYFNASDLILKTIAGKLPNKCKALYCQSNIIERVQNNMFDKTNNGLLYVILNSNKINTHNINEILRYIYEAKSSNTLSGFLLVNTKTQTPLAPPTVDEGISFFINYLRKNSVTVTTD